jgi:hypothetical protein
MTVVTTTGNAQPGGLNNTLYNAATSGLASVAANPQTAYGGPLVAGTTGPQWQALANQTGIAGYQAPTVNAGNVTQYAGGTGQGGVSTQGMNLSGYMNPYTSQVIGTSLDEINRNLAVQQQQSSGQAAMSGAFGGDRAAIVNTENARNANMAANQMVAGLNSQNYTQAQTQANTDLTRQLTAGQQQAQLGLQAGQGNQFANIQAANLQNTANNSLYQMGTQQQTNQTQQNQAQYDQFLRNEGLPLANATSQAQAWQPYAPSLSTSVTTAPDPSTLSAYGGLGAAAIGALGATGGANGNNSLLSQGLGALGNGVSNAYNWLTGSGGTDTWSGLGSNTTASNINAATDSNYWNNLGSTYDSSYASGGVVDDGTYLPAYDDGGVVDPDSQPDTSQSDITADPAYLAGLAQGNQNARQQLLGAADAAPTPAVTPRATPVPDDQGPVVPADGYVSGLAAAADQDANAHPDAMAGVRGLASDIGGAMGKKGSYFDHAPLRDSGYGGIAGDPADNGTPTPPPYAPMGIAAVRSGVGALDPDYVQPPLTPGDTSVDAKVAARQQRQWWGNLANFVRSPVTQMNADAKMPVEEYQPPQVDGPPTSGPIAKAVADAHQLIRNSGYPVDAAAKVAADQSDGTVAAADVLKILAPQAAAAAAPVQTQPDAAPAAGIAAANGPADTPDARAGTPADIAAGAAAVPAGLAATQPVPQPGAQPGLPVSQPGSRPGAPANAPLPIPPPVPRQIVAGPARQTMPQPRAGSPGAPGIPQPPIPPQSPGNFVPPRPGQTVPGPQAQAQQQQAQPQQQADALARAQAQARARAAELQPTGNAWSIPLMAAGFGMMAGTSPHAAVNIGQGGLAGLNAYAQQRSATATMGLKQQQQQWNHDYQMSRVQAQQDATKERAQAADDRTQMMAQWHGDANATNQQRIAMALALKSLGASVGSFTPYGFDLDGNALVMNRHNGAVTNTGVVGGMSPGQRAANDLATQRIMSTQAYRDRMVQLRAAGLSETAAHNAAVEALRAQGEGGHDFVTGKPNITLNQGADAVAGLPARQAGAAQPARPAPPKPGDVMQGYRFKGGDPSQQTNWEPAQ